MGNLTTNYYDQAGRLEMPGVKYTDKNADETILWASEETQKKPSKNKPGLEELLLSRYKVLLGSKVQIEIEVAKQIEPAPSGKAKLVVSNYKQ